MGLFGSSIQVGYIVDDLAVTGPARGTYKVWIPKRSWNPFANDYTGFGINIGNLGPGDLANARHSAKDCYPLFPLSAGGAKPFDPETGIISTDDSPMEVSEKSAVKIDTKGRMTRGKAYHPEGDGAGFFFSQTNGAHALSQSYVLSTKHGFSANTRTNAPGGSFSRLSIGTKVAVIDNFIIGMLPEHQNDWINQFKPLNQS